MVNENASLIKYEPPKCDECGRKIVVLSDLCAKCAAGIELNGKEQANRPGTNPLPTWPKPPAPPNPPPAPTNLLGLLKGAFDWIESAPHGDNCFVSDHYEGDPGNQCNCGKDSLVSAYEEFGQPEAPAVAQGEPVGLRELFERLLFCTYAGKDSYYNEEQIKHGCFERAQELADAAKRMNIALYTEAPAVANLSDAYHGAREDLAIWKKRALEAEELNRKFIADINGQTFMGEPAPAAAINEQLYTALEDLLAITRDSQGVAGYHLNGVVAKWDEFEEVSAAEAAIAAAEAEKAKGGE